MVQTVEESKYGQL